MKKSLFTTRDLAQAGIVAALYTALIFVAPLHSHGIFQIRASEALTILPIFTPVAIPGLFVGVVVANFLNPHGMHMVDVIFGSLTTLIAAYSTYQIGKHLKIHEFPKFLVAMIPPVALNALIVGTYVQILWYPAYPIWIAWMLVGFGQIIACYGLGGILYVAMKKAKMPI